ncbi:MAG: AAA family ATPase [Pseudomonadota bacterium]
MTTNYITRIHIQNYRGFRDLEISDLDPKLNILIGDNDTGKSSILSAIDLALSCNLGRIESIGLDRLLNLDAVNEYLELTKRSFEDLPILEIDIYLNEQGRHELDGEFNLKQCGGYGVALICRPNDDLRDLIEEVISSDKLVFPYEYYVAEIKGFGGESLNSYKKPIQHLQIDNTKISNDYASRAHVRDIYRASTDDKVRNELRYSYRRLKTEFAEDHFKELDEKADDDYSFRLRSGTKANVDTDMTIAKGGLDIEDLGVGSQCFIRTSFALSKKTSTDVVLIEEPENHLSHAKMRLLIEKIAAASQSQLFITTHSSLICSRLDLRHAILMPDSKGQPTRLSDLPKSTAEFFMKAPNSCVLEFALSDKNILVEGDAEYILIPAMFENSTQKELSEAGINVISIGGVSFPRYLDIAKLLGNKTAVVRDNDGKSEQLEERYKPYRKDDLIEVFMDPDNENRTTFEKCVYRDNKAVCDELFGPGRKTLTVEEYMLSNKTAAAYELASKKADKIIAPEYIKNAAVWISS